MSSYENGHRTRLSRIYHNMKTRCTNPNYDKYQYYGGKGVSVCREWMDSYKAFADWAMASGYTDDLTLERIDVNGNYEPDNCWWATMKDQANNRTNNRVLTYRGTTQTMAQWSQQSGIPQNTIWARLNAGWDIKRALTERPHSECRPSYITMNGITKSVSEWSRETGLRPTTITRRINRGWSVEKALTTPVGGTR